MSLITPILTLMSSARACTAARTTATAVMYKTRFIPFLLLNSISGSHTKIVVQLVEVGVQLRAGEAFDHTAILHHIVPVGDGRGEPKVLLNQKDGEATLLQLADGFADLLDDDGSKPLGRLVEQ